MILKHDLDCEYIYEVDQRKLDIFTSRRFFSRGKTAVIIRYSRIVSTKKSGSFHFQTFSESVYLSIRTTIPL